MEAHLRGVRVTAHRRWYDACVSNTNPFQTAHAQLRIDDRRWIANRSHLAGAHRSVARQRDVAEVALEVGGRPVSEFGALWEETIAYDKVPILQRVHLYQVTRKLHR